MDIHVNEKEAHSWKLQWKQQENGCVIEQNQNAQLSQFGTCIHIEICVYMDSNEHWMQDILELFRGFQHISNKWNVAKIPQSF